LAGLAYDRARCIEFSPRSFSANQVAWGTLVVVSMFFGLAHLVGGFAYALVATVASVGYGWVK